MTSCFLQIYNHKWGHTEWQLLNQNTTTTKKRVGKGLSKPLPLPEEKSEQETKGFIS